MADRTATPSKRKPKTAPSSTHQEQIDFLQHQNLLRMLERRAKGEPVFTQPLLAYPEDQEYETHTQPREALLALVGILHSHHNATIKACQLDGLTEGVVEVHPGHMASLLEIIANQMRVEFTTVEAAMTVRSLVEKFDKRGAK